MPMRWCHTCRIPIPMDDWQTHRQAHDKRRQWSHNRDQAAHKRFARAVKKRDGYRCVTCGFPDDLRAAHLVPIAAGGSYDLENGRTLCRRCDRATDPHAR